MIAGKVLFSKSDYGRYEFIVPQTGKYKLECWGAAGGVGYGGGNPYGLGGYACGETRFNGGGASYASSGHNGGRGGGASDIRRLSDDLNHRIIVAGGGGGSSYIGTLENAITISGNASMPSPSGSTQTGNSGNGSVKITLLSISTCHYVLYNIDENKYYIPNKCFYNETTDSFDPVTMDYLKDYKNNFYKFMYNINDIIKRMYHESKSFLPIEKLNTKNIKLVKIDIYDGDFDNVILNTNLSSSSNVFNATKVNIKYNISSDNINNSIVKIPGFHQDDNYSYRFIDIGNNENIKILIKGWDKFYGKDLKETNIDRILIDGIDGIEINRYELDFLNFDIYIAFKNKAYNQKDILNKISFNTKEFQNMKNISDSDFQVFYDKDKDKILIKFNKTFNNVLVNKLDNAEIQYEKSIENF